MIDNPPPSPPSPEPPLNLKRTANPEKESIPRESKPEHPRGRTAYLGATRRTTRQITRRIHEHAH